MELSSRIPGFYKMTMVERKKHLIERCGLNQESADHLMSGESLPEATADNMIENVIGTFGLPLAVGLNFNINNKDYIIQMAVEEASIVASASYIAKIVREAGGFKAEATDRIMIGQVQVVVCADFELAKEAVASNEEMLVKAANDVYPRIVKRGGGAEDLDVRILDEGHSSYNKMSLVHLYANTVDAMGANMINTMAEAIAP